MVIEEPADLPDDATPLPWPRRAEDGTPLGVDLAKHHRDVARIVGAKFRPETVDPDDLVQETCLAILRKNRQACAYDPRRASLGKYVYTVARSTLGHLLERQRSRAWLVTEAEPPELADERDPLAAFEVADEIGLTAAQLEASLDREAERAEAAALAPKAVQLGLW